jgi:hypothetical protein
LDRHKTRRKLRTKLAECIVISALDIGEEEDALADEALRCLHETHLMNHDVPLT